MINNGAIPRSWREAAAYAQTPMSTLRAAIKRGNVPAPTAGPDGRTAWDVGALDALRAARGQVALSGAPTAPVSTPVNAPNATLSTSPPMEPLPPWMFAAAVARDAASERDVDVADAVVDDEDEDQARQPYMGIPLGSSRTWTPGASWPYSAVAGTMSTDSLRTAELELQLAGAIAQRDSWYRAARIKSIADTIAAEAMAASSGDVSAAQVVAYAAAQALGSLPVEQLSIDAIAFSLARDAGHRAAVAWQAQQAPWLPPRDPHDEIARARARRRSRSPRW